MLKVWKSKADLEHVVNSEHYSYSLLRADTLAYALFGLMFVTPPSGRGLIIPFFSRGFCSFFGRHLPQTSGFRSAKQILVVSFATQARAFILSDRNIFCTPGRGEQRRGLMPLGLFLFSLFSIFLLVSCPRPPVFAQPNILVASFATQYRLELVSWVTIKSFTPRGEGERRGNAPGAFLVFQCLLRKCKYADHAIIISAFGHAENSYSTKRVVWDWQI